MRAESTWARAAPTADRLVLVADLGATAMFALEGALAAIAAGLDLFGILVVGFATALGGGIIRDMVIGAGPPLAMRLRRYPIAALAAAAVAIALAIPAREIPEGILVALDAGGLALFAVSGARRALDFGLNEISAALLGALTGVGGGVIQAILLNRVPAVLVEEIYASAALLGAVTMIVGVRRGAPAGPMMALGAAVCFALRMVGWWQGWDLPTVGY
ncbi:MAG: trimeric intracellular cation channel family protein [Acidobacteria bacterium]|nr:MAG: trimeric intracellular cation channel family protein [Acidobacteriota bacterium]GIK78426.1 MAG: membrane protein [Actinomycetes bacterium]